MPLDVTTANWLLSSDLVIVFVLRLVFLRLILSSEIKPAVVFFFFGSKPFSFSAPSFSSFSFTPEGPEWSSIAAVSVLGFVSSDAVDF